MIDTLSTSEAARRLRESDSSFGYSGSIAMVEYLEQLEDETGTPIKLDPVAIRCNYAQYADVFEFWQDYYGEPADPDEDEEDLIDQLRDETTVIEFDGGIIVGSF